MKKLVKILVLLPLLLGTAKVGAQVTMGADAAPQPFSVLELIAQYKSGTYGGLRLPQMTTTDRNGLSATYGSQVLFEGLLIYNLDSKCIEYWNATKWVSLCLGTANITLTGDCDPEDPFPADGTKVCTFIPSDDPPCVPASGAPYSVYLIMGAGYASLQITDAATAEFSLTFSENNTAYVRTAIVRVMNNCTNEYKEFVFTQDGADCVASPPFSLDKTSTELCGDNGAVIAWVTDPKPGVNYIWSLSGVAVHTGNYMQITSAGKWTVYAGLLGCTNPTPQTLTITRIAGSSSNAPVVTATNGGVLCNGGEVILTASNIVAGNDVLWFHNDSLCRSCTTNPLVLNSSGDAGEWFATQQDDPCGSRMSNIVTVIDETATSTTLPTPVIYANGELLTNSTIVCKNGTVELEIYNAGVYAAATVYEWYDNGVKFFSGTESVIYYNVPDEDKMNLWVQASNLSGYCPAMAVSDPVDVILPAPPATDINNGASTATICGVTPATLLARNTSEQQYQWFKDGVSIGITTTPSYQAYIAGVYTVRFEDIQGCWSPFSPPITVTLSAPLTLSWSSEPVSPVNETESKTYTVSSSPPTDNYVWSSLYDTIATVTPIPPGNTAFVNYIGLGKTFIRVDAENDCGPAYLEKEVEVVSACTPINSVIITPPTTIFYLSLNVAGNPKAGDEVVNFVADAMGGTAPVSYEWYVNSALKDTGPSFTYFTVPSLVTVDTLYVTAKNGCTPPNTIKSTKVLIVVTQDTLPHAPGDIVGNDNPCANATGVTYTVPPVAGMTYTWTLPTDWTITSSPINSNSITVTVGTASGDIEVVANNSCCTGPATTLSVTVNTVPATPGAISGPASVDIGCGAHTYSIASVAGATEYVWSLPSGWTGYSDSDTISATPPASGSGGSGDIKVWAKNICGTNPTESTYPVTVIPTNLTVSQTSLTFGDCPCSQTISVSANASDGWTFSVSGADAAGFTVTQSGNDLIVYPNDVNPSTTTPRTATITVTAACLTETVTVTQKQYQDPGTPARFDYTGDCQAFTIRQAGYYKIELWGAMGGQYAGIPGTGGYTSGEIYLDEGTNLYIYDGGRNNTLDAPFNGGGAGYSSVPSQAYASSGGGATDVRFWGDNIPTYSNLNWNDATGLNNRIMVAAGGGGGAQYSTFNNPTLTHMAGGAGGGLNGLNGVAHYWMSAPGITTTDYASVGATQTSGYAFGHAGSTSGGGYYGGFLGGTTNYVASGAGGSSFISGHAGCNAITSITDRTHTGQPNHYSGMIFTNTVMTAGNASMPDPDGGTQTGHGSSGVAVITFLGP